MSRSSVKCQLISNDANSAIRNAEHSVENEFLRASKCLVGKQTNAIYIDVFMLGTQAQRFKGAKFKFVSKVAYRLLFSYLRNRLLDIEMDIYVCLNHLMPFFQACVDRNILPILIKGKSSFFTKFVN